MTYVQYVIHVNVKSKVKVSRDRPRWPQGVPGRLRSRIFLTCDTTRVVGHQPHAPATFTPEEIPGTHFKGTRFCRGEPRKKFPVTPLGIDPGTVRLVAQHLNHYANPGPIQVNMVYLISYRNERKHICVIS